MKHGKPAKSDAPMQVQTHEKTTKILNREIQAKIGQQLRAMYKDVEDQGVPERFIELLRRLDGEGERKQEDKGSE